MPLVHNVWQIFKEIQLSTTPEPSVEFQTRKYLFVEIIIRTPIYKKKEIFWLLVLLKWKNDKLEKYVYSKYPEIMFSAIISF